MRPYCGSVLATVELSITKYSIQLSTIQICNNDCLQHLEFIIYYKNKIDLTDERREQKNNA